MVFREGDEGPWTPLSPQVPGGGTAYTFHPATAGIVYDFVVVALAGPSQPIASFCQSSATGQGPPCPQGLTAIRQSDGVSLSWSAVEGADGYNIYRSVDGGPFEFKGHVTATSAVDGETSDEGTDITQAARSYMVKATLAEGQSGACRDATLAEIPFFQGPFAWTMALLAVAGAATLLVCRKP